MPVIMKVAQDIDTYKCFEMRINKIISDEVINLI